MVESMREAGTITTTRRRFVLSLAAAFGAGTAAGVAGFRIWTTKGDGSRKAARSVIPADGYKTSVSFGDSIQRLNAAGALDSDKFRRLYQSRGGLAPWVERLLAAPSAEPITISLETAPYLLNLFWPIGLSTKAGFNEESPLNGDKLSFFASTGGWTLGREENGAAYFNQVEAVLLSEAQEKVVFDVAGNCYRPCCDNSTFFQDCNHGSALLGLLELAASQGIASEELYRTALAANSYWYPRQYVETAVYFKEVEGQSWHEVPPETVLGPRFSSASGWRRNVHAALEQAKLLPGASQGRQAGCAA